MFEEKRTQIDKFKSRPDSAFESMRKKIMNIRNQPEMRMGKKNHKIVGKGELSVVQRSLLEISNTYMEQFQKGEMGNQKQGEKFTPVKYEFKEVIHKFQGYSEIKKEIKQNRFLKLRTEQNSKVKKKEKESEVIRLNLNSIILHHYQASVDNPPSKKDERSRQRSYSRSRSKSQSQNKSSHSTNPKRRSTSTYVSPQYHQNHNNSPYHHYYQQTPRFHPVHSIKTFSSIRTNPITNPPPEPSSNRKMFPNSNYTPSNIYLQHYRSNPNLFITPQKQRMVMMGFDVKENEEGRRRSKSRGDKNMSVTDFGGEENQRKSEKRHFRSGSVDKVGGIIRQY